MYYAPKCNNPLKIPNLNFSILIEAVQQVIEWLDTTVPLNHGWASYHVSQKRCKRRRKGFISALLFLREKVHTLGLQYHCMNIATNTINKLNPGQPPVDLCNQPVFALTKQIQWKLLLLI